MWRVLIILSLIVVTSSTIHAQEESPPLYFLNDGGIYALSVDDGTIETLVEPPADYEALRELTFDPVTLFSAEWMSPDREYLAYRVLTKAVGQDEEDGVYTHQLFLLNLPQASDPIVVTLSDDETMTVNVNSVAWSDDGAAMYVLMATQTAEQSEFQWSLLIFERGAWDSSTHIEVTAPQYAHSRSIFAIEQGVVLFDSGVQSPSYQFEIFNPAGESISVFTIDSNVSMDVNLYSNTPFNPVSTTDGARFGLNHYITSELIYQADFLTGEISQSEPGYFASMVSRAAPETSMSITITQSSIDTGGLLFRNSDNTVVDSLERVRLYAFSISGQRTGSTFTLSPDGQTLAFVEGGMIFLRRDEQTIALEIPAEVVAWQSPYYVPIYDLMWLAG